MLFWLKQLKQSLQVRGRHALAQIQRYHRLTNLYKEALKSSADHGLAYVHWGVQLAQLNELPQALQKFEQGVQLAPERPEGWTHWGIALAQQGRLQEALEKFEQATKLAPRLAANYVLWGAALLELGEAEAGEAKYQHAVSLEPDNPDSFANWGLALARAGRYKEAAERFKHAIGLYPLQSQVYFLWGTVLAELGQFETATEKFAQAVHIRPRYPEAFYLWAVALNHLGQWGQAIEKIKQALMLSPDKPEFYITLGDCLAHQGQLDVAMANYRQALAINPNLPEAFLKLGLTLCQLGKHSEGWAMFERSKVLDPNYPGLARRWGLSLLEKGEAAEALLQLEEALKQEALPGGNEEESLLLMAMATAYKRLQQPVKALACLQQVQNAQNATVQFMLGTYYLSSGYLSAQALQTGLLPNEPWRLAKTHLQEALALNPSYEEAACNLALLLFQQNKVVEALRLLRPFYRSSLNKLSPYAVPPAVLVYSLLDGLNQAHTHNEVPEESIIQLNRLISKAPKHLGLQLATLQLSLWHNPVQTEGATLSVRQWEQAKKIWQGLSKEGLAQAGEKEQWLAQWLEAKLLLTGVMLAKEPKHEAALSQATALSKQCVLQAPATGQAWGLWFKTVFYSLTRVETLEAGHLHEAFTLQWNVLLEELLASSVPQESTKPSEGVVSSLTKTLPETIQAALLWGWQHSLNSFTPQHQAKLEALYLQVKAQGHWPVASTALKAEEGASPLLMWVYG